MHHGVNCRNGTCESRAVDGCDLTTTGGEVTTPALQGVRQTQHQARKVAVTPPITSLTQGEFLPADYSHPPTIPIRTEMELTCDITTSGGLTVNADLHADLGLEGKVAIVAGGGAAGDGIGNGRAAAILLARAGARVLVVDRSLDLAEGTVRMIAAEGALYHRPDARGRRRRHPRRPTARQRYGGGAGERAPGVGVPLRVPSTGYRSGCGVRCARTRRLRLPLQARGRRPTRRHRRQSGGMQ